MKMPGERWCASMSATRLPRMITARSIVRNIKRSRKRTSGCLDYRSHRLVGGCGMIMSLSHYTHNRP